MNDFEQWAAGQLDRAGYRPEAGPKQQIVRTSVLTLSRAFGEMKFAVVGVEVEQAVVAIFTELMNHRALPELEDTRAWAPSRQLPPSIGGTVKVRPDAFEGVPGQEYNGRVGIVQGARRGDFIVAFTDDRAPDTLRTQAHMLLTLMG